MSRRALLTIGGLAVAGGGYYLYSAGGDPKTATKMAEHDASRASAKIQSELPGKGKELQKKGEASLASAGKAIDDTVAQGRSKGKELEGKLGTKFDEIRRDTNSAVDKFDKTVERKTSEAKSGISGWFGGSK